jgi:hypothetical protein
MSKLWGIIRALVRRKSMLIPNANELINDRIKFKYYAAEKHLSALKGFVANGETIYEDTSRIRFEIEMEDLLSHLIGTIDSLLFRINKKLSLGLNPQNIFVRTVNDKLDKIGRKDILKDLNDLLDPNFYPKNLYAKGSWLSILYELRNVGMHRAIIPKRVDVNLYENVNTGQGWSGPTKIYFAADPESKLEMIPYLEDRIQKMKDLINGILQKEPSLASP